MCSIWEQVIIGVVSLLVYIIEINSVKTLSMNTLTRDFCVTTKKTKISEGYLVRENVKSLSNSVTKFCDQGICEEFHFFRH